MAARLVMQHKPYSFLSPSTKWQGNKRFAADLLTRANQRGGERVELRELRALECMGRLDADSTGLMLWSNDPVLADRVKHPSSRVEKEYLVRVRGHETWSDLERGSAIDALRSGMILDGRRHLPAMAGWLNEAQLRVVLVEGKHRQIRKMCEALGLEVSGLKRVRVGCIRLGGQFSCTTMSAKVVFGGLAAAAGFASGVFDRPWLQRYFRVSWWPSLALAMCAGYRALGGQRSLCDAALGSLSPRMGLVVRDAACVLLVARVAGVLSELRRASLQDVKEALVRAALDVARAVPASRRRLEREFEKVEADLRVSLKKDMPRPPIVELPRKGRPASELAAELGALGAREDDKWKQGLVSGAVYHGEAEHLELLNAAMAAYAVANPLHSDIWPSVSQMEAEVIAMTARLVGGADVCGTTSSGGTESIILATKAHRDKMRRERGIVCGEVVACVTAHAAIDKACDLLGLGLVKVPANADFTMDVAAAARALTSDTIMLYASAPSFPQGVVDDIAAMSELATSAGVGLHVDCCLGGFVLPFLEERPQFDFSLPGVTSMSLDTHKYGYAPKGTSVVLYRNRDYRKYQYFCFPSWTGGLYVTPTIPGSRPGSVSVATWASLVSIGREGFEARAREIVKTANDIAAGVAKIPHIKLLGARDDNTVHAMIVCFASDDLNIYAVNDRMVEFGWSLNALQNPPCVHLCCTVRTVGKTDRFLHDLREAVDHAVRTPAGEGGSAAIYGMANSMPAGPVTDVLQIFTDIQLSV
ncbi:hypothetical protein CTAYLR_007774 [Chrysophaeum taylorii]|uniref:sphinganine-1-phosphate aldolase n=1 Tax=Chrysophaeum taylorii TaxID=2483200 RepID=A0AAD7UMB5_9STRA|nr:hypothetical protein CTAYLR_007774 [Chrysophaeum taylorii]